MAANPGKEKARFPFTHKRILISKSAQDLQLNVLKRIEKCAVFQNYVHFSKLPTLIPALQFLLKAEFIFKKFIFRFQRNQLLCFKQMYCACPNFTAWPASALSLPRSLPCTALMSVLQRYLACF